MNKLNKNEVYSIQIGAMIYNFKWLRNCNYSKKGIFIADSDNAELISVIYKNAKSNNINTGYSLGLNMPTLVLNLSQVDMARNGMRVDSFEEARKWLINSCKEIHKFKPVENTVKIKLRIAKSIMLNAEKYDAVSEKYFTEKLTSIADEILKQKLVERKEYVDGVLNEMPF